MKSFKDDLGFEHLGLFALPDKDIDPGTELRYSYGEKKESTKEEFVWRYTEEVYAAFFCIYLRFFFPLSYSNKSSLTQLFSFIQGKYLEKPFMFWYDKVRKQVKIYTYG